MTLPSIYERAIYEREFPAFSIISSMSTALGSISTFSVFPNEY